MSVAEVCCFCNKTERYTTYITRKLFLCSDKYCHQSVCSDCSQEVQCMQCERYFCSVDHLRKCTGCKDMICIDCVELEQGNDDSAPSMCRLCLQSAGEPRQLQNNFVKEEEISARLRNALEFEIEPLTSKVPAIMEMLEPVLLLRERLRRIYLNKRIRHETKMQQIFNLCSNEWRHELSENDKKCSGEVDDAQIDEDGRYQQTE